MNLRTSAQPRCWAIPKSFIKNNWHSGTYYFIIQRTLPNFQSVPLSHTTQLLWLLRHVNEIQIGVSQKEKVGCLGKPWRFKKGISNQNVCSTTCCISNIGHISDRFKLLFSECHHGILRPNNLLKYILWNSYNSRFHEELLLPKISKHSESFADHLLGGIILCLISYLKYYFMSHTYLKWHHWPETTCKKCFNWVTYKKTFRNFRNVLQTFGNNSPSWKRLIFS